MDTRKTGLRASLIVLTAAAFVYGVFYLPSQPVGASSGEDPAPTPRRRASTAVKRASAVPKKAKFKEFPHSAKAHRLECNSCHKFPSPNWNKVRDEKVAFPDQTDYPHHETCVGCHKQQFFKGRPPKVCSICHTNPSPRDSSRHPFPNPRELFDGSPKG